MRLLGTEVKYFDRDTYKIPEYGNTWGCIVDYLDTCLVNGTEGQEVLSITTEEDPWRYDYIKTYNPISGKVFSSRLGVKDQDKNFLGYHRGLQVFYGKDYPATPRLTGTPYMVVRVEEAYHSGLMAFLFTLENWEDPS